MNQIAHAKFGLGAPLRRKEDAAFVTGQGRFTDDFRLEGELHGVVVRSPHAHAHFKITDVTEAKSFPGVHLVLTAADIPHIAPLRSQVPVKQPDGSMATPRDIPVLCHGIVRHVGDAIAFVVADSAAIARDAAEKIEVDWEPLDAMAATASALTAGAPLVHADSGSNLAFLAEFGDHTKAGAAFDKAAKTASISIINNRLVANYIEPRACIAQWLANEDRWSVIVCSQGVHGMQSGLAKSFGVPREKIHVRTADVGGGFGTKAFNYREYVLTLEAAKRLGHPVRWTCDRSEHFVADAHGRDNVVNARMAMDADGKFLAIEVDLIAAMGAYLHQFGGLIPTMGVSMTTGVYDIPQMAVTVRGVYTHTTPVDAYRGAGRPEAAYLIERLVDECARVMDLPREEIRRRNFIKPAQMPYTTPGRRMYDTGDFDGQMTEALERAGWAGFAARAAEAKSRGKVRGIGFATYIEACAFAGSEPAFLNLKADGTITLRIGTQSNGQGHATAYAQLAAEKLCLDFDKIDVRQGDTDELPSGGGTGGSRSVPLGGVSVVAASDILAEKLKKLAGEEMEASAGDIELADGMARVAGTDKAVSFAALFKAAKSPQDVAADANIRQAEATYPNGTHVCEVEIDPETGTVEIVAYTMVDDFGVTVNPILLAGQVHGGVVQGIGQALCEETLYDETGQLLTASFMDYAMPSASMLPHLDFKTRNVPSTTNALGIKGAGEAGSIGSSPAVMNAVVHALGTNYGVWHIDMPATPQKVWQAINGSGR